MIKKTLLGLGISLISFLCFGFVYAVDCYTNQYVSCPSEYFYLNNSAIISDGLGNLFELRNGVNFLTNSQYKALQVSFKYNNNQYPSTLYWYDGKLYLHTKIDNNYYNRYITTYCDSSYGDHCSNNIYDQDIISFINNSQYYNPNWLYLFRVATDGMGFCLGYESLNKEICFDIRRQNPDNIYHSSLVESDIGFNNSGTPIGILDNNTLLFGNSPISGGGGGGSSNNSNNTYLCPTVGQLLNTYSSEYNTGLCYSSSLIYSGNSVVSVSPQSIFELFTDQSDFINYRQLYSNNCNLSPMSDNTACNNIFQGKNLQYSLIAKIPGTVNSLNLYSYCNLALNQDPNTSTCVASGVYNTGFSRQDVINSINNGNYQIISPSSGSVASDVLGSGMTYNGDILDTLQSLYSKFTSLFTTQSGNVVGILPTYIISMLLVIILFKLFKK